MTSHAVRKTARVRGNHSSPSASPSLSPSPFARPISTGARRPERAKCSCTCKSSWTVCPEGSRPTRDSVFHATTLAARSMIHIHADRAGCSFTHSAPCMQRSACVVQLIETVWAETSCKRIQDLDEQCCERACKARAHRIMEGRAGVSSVYAPVVCLNAAAQRHVHICVRACSELSGKILMVDGLFIYPLSRARPSHCGLGNTATSALRSGGLVGVMTAACPVNCHLRLVGAAVSAALS